MRAVVLEDAPREAFRPWVIRREPGLLGSASYMARLLIDTPHRSLIGGVKPLVRHWSGRVLDIGAGAQFYRRFLPASVRYTALERATKEQLYGWEDMAIDLYDGRVMPYEAATFDHALCLEVLEHAEEPDALLREIARVLKPGGTAVISVPFAAKWHYVPYDYWRFTPSGLDRVVRQAGLQPERLYRRGGEVAVTFHHATVALLGLLFRPSWAAKALGAALLPLGLACGLLANLSELADWGAPENTLGYLALLRKPGEPSAQER